MKLEENSGEMDLGFEIVPAGIYIWQFDEGIKIFQKEDSKARSLFLPMIVDTVIDGDEAAAEDGKAVFFINVRDKKGEITSMGEKTLQTLLSATGVINKLSDKFDDVEPDDDKFVNVLKLSKSGLLGKKVQLTHEVKKNSETGKDQMNFTKIRPAKKKGKVEKKEEGEEEFE